MHPNLLANQRIAATIADALRAAGIPVPSAEWTGVAAVPPADALHAGEPALRAQERQVRASACILARRDDCAHEAIDAVLANDPGNALALQLRDGMAKRAARAGDGEAADGDAPAAR